MALVLIAGAPRACLVVVALLLLALAAGAADAQEGLRVVTEKERAEGAHYTINGMVLNEGRRDALDIYVTVQALDGARKVVASGITFVAPNLPPGARAPFVAKIPKMPNATSFRASITGYRFGLGGGGESP
jgi:hypothetical protein